MNSMQINIELPSANVVVKSLIMDAANVLLKAPSSANKKSRIEVSETFEFHLGAFQKVDLVTSATCSSILLDRPCRSLITSDWTNYGLVQGYIKKVGSTNYYSKWHFPLYDNSNFYNKPGANVTIVIPQSHSSTYIGTSSTYTPNVAQGTIVNSGYMKFVIGSELSLFVGALFTNINENQSTEKAHLILDGKFFFCVGDTHREFVAPYLQNLPFKLGGTIEMLSSSYAMFYYANIDILPELNLIGNGEIETYSVLPTLSIKNIYTDINVNHDWVIASPDITLSLKYNTRLKGTGSLNIQNLRQKQGAIMINVTTKNLLWEMDDNNTSELRGIYGGVSVNITGFFNCYAIDRPQRLYWRLNDKSKINLLPKAHAFWNQCYIMSEGDTQQKDPSAVRGTIHLHSNTFTIMESGYNAAIPTTSCCLCGHSAIDVRVIQDTDSTLQFRMKGDKSHCAEQTMIGYLRGGGDISGTIDVGENSDLPYSKFQLAMEEEFIFRETSIFNNSGWVTMRGMRLEYFDSSKIFDYADPVIVQRRRKLFLNSLNIPKLYADAGSYLTSTNGKELTVGQLFSPQTWIKDLVMTVTKNAAFDYNPGINHIFDTNSKVIIQKTATNTNTPNARVLKGAEIYVAKDSEFVLKKEMFSTSNSLTEFGNIIIDGTLTVTDSSSTSSFDIGKVHVKNNGIFQAKHIDPAAYSGFGSSIRFYGSTFTQSSSGTTKLKIRDFTKSTSNDQFDFYVYDSKCDRLDGILELDFSEVPQSQFAAGTKCVIMRMKTDKYCNSFFSNIKTTGIPNNLSIGFALEKDKLYSGLHNVHAVLCATSDTNCINGRPWSNQPSPTDSTVVPSVSAIKSNQPAPNNSTGNRAQSGRVNLSVKLHSNLFFLIVLALLMLTLL
ncbi:hypothetical protein ABK040_007793 [Willaertia magna]